jgi:hypothetical protein
VRIPGGSQTSSWVSATGVSLFPVPVTTEQIAEKTLLLRGAAVSSAAVEALKSAKAFTARNRIEFFGKL